MLGMALVVLSLPHRHQVPLFGSLVALTTDDRLVRCPSDIDVSSWQTFRSAALGFEVRFPATFVAQETASGMTLLEKNTATGSVRTSIVFERFRSSLEKEVTSEMRQGSWKVADRQTYALTTSYFTSDDLRSLSESYLFIRDFPLKPREPSYSMTRATITMDKDNPLLAAIKKATIVDPEQLLSEPEQILSTFRFLQYDELPGRDTGVPHGV